jgi:hypothetical protein
MLPRFGAVVGHGASGGDVHCHVGLPLQGPPRPQLLQMHDVPFSSQPEPSTVHVVPCAGSEPTAHSGAVAQTCPDVSQMPL